ncbi:hypothetical protein Dimus_019458 [Dionaea muscipula]
MEITSINFGNKTPIEGLSSKISTIVVPAFNSVINHQIQPNDENKLDYKDELFSFLKFCRNLGAHLKKIVHTISFADAEMESQRIWPEFLPVLHQYYRVLLDSSSLPCASGSSQRLLWCSSTQLAVPTPKFPPQPKNPRSPSSPQEIQAHSSDGRNPQPLNRAPEEC